MLLPHEKDDFEWLIRALIVIVISSGAMIYILMTGGY